MERARKQYSEETKKRAIEDYVAGRKSAAEIAAEIGCAPNLIYRWKVEFESNRRALRIHELEASGHNPKLIKRIMSLEDELEEYKKKVAEQALVIDLLKKLDPSHSPFESELTGLIRTTKSSARFKRLVK